MATTTAQGRATLIPVTDDLARRGRLLTQRRLRHDLRHTEVATATGIGRKTVARAEAGEASDDSVTKLEMFFDELDTEKGVDTTGLAEVPVPADTMEFEVTGPRTEWTVTVRGPVENEDVLVKAVLELLREVPQQPSGD